jgi:hypothetical protein
MKNLSNSILNTTALVIISLIIMLYFGYDIIKPIIDFLNVEIKTSDDINVIVNFFK